MSDLPELQSTFNNSFFHIACQDVARIVSILSLDSTDITKPKSKQPFFIRIYEKSLFICRFFYMVFLKGFTPMVFDVLPYHVWMILTTFIYLYRLWIVPFWLRFTGYGKYASWSDLGSKQPSKDSSVASLPQNSLSLSKKERLAKLSFGDDNEYERFLAHLYQLTTHLAPHSQSPGNIFSHSSSSFPGNFFNHLTGVGKILLAWKQPIYVRRAGLFHSVYGTFDYRASLYDLAKDGRKELAALIGSEAEELAFALCTSDRIGLMQDLYKSMYGSGMPFPTSGSSAISSSSSSSSAGASSECSSPESTSVNSDDFDKQFFISSAVDGNPYPKRLHELSPLGYPVRNHITQEIHILSSDFFAQFMMVTIADFMEQGAVGFGSKDLDICLFQFMRYRFFNDLLMFIKPFLRSLPPVWMKYMGNNNFLEPTRQEITIFKKHWKAMLQEYLIFSQQHTTIHSSSSSGSSSSTIDKSFQYSNIKEFEYKSIFKMIHKYPYLAEPKIFIASTLAINEQSQVFTCFACFLLFGVIILSWSICYRDILDNC
jgi:hypothetical protein